jgi:hypothetical protein
MNKESNLKSIWLAPNQRAWVAQALKAGEFQSISEQFQPLFLTECSDLSDEYNGKKVLLWKSLENHEDSNPVLAVVQNPDYTLRVATRGDLLMIFNDGVTQGLNAALITTQEGRYQFFGVSPQNRIPEKPAFRAVNSDLAHYAMHMIDKPHGCSL